MENVFVAVLMFLLKTNANRKFLDAINMKMDLFVLNVEVPLSSSKATVSQMAKM